MTEISDEYSDSTVLLNTYNIFLIALVYVQS